jgi:hypothetical protein
LRRGEDRRADEDALRSGHKTPDQLKRETRCLRFRQIASGSPRLGARPVLNDDPRAAHVAEEQQSEAELPPLKIAETERVEDTIRIVPVDRPERVQRAFELLVKARRPEAQITERGG